MENRFNEATINRPKGTRLIDAKMIFTDLEAIVDQLRTEKAWDTNDQNGITIFKNENITQVVTLMKEGTFVKRNQVDTGISLLVLKGNLRVDTEEQQYNLMTAQLLQLNPMRHHSITAMEETIIFQITHSSK